MNNFSISSPLPYCEKLDRLDKYHHHVKIPTSSDQERNVTISRPMANDHHPLCCIQLNLRDFTFVQYKDKVGVEFPHATCINLYRVPFVTREKNTRENVRYKRELVEAKPSVICIKS